MNYSLKDTESAIRIKLKDLVTELKGFEFVMPLVLEFKNMQSDGETKYRTFYVSSKAEYLLMRVMLMMCLDQSILRLYQTYKNHLEKVQAELLIQL